MAQTQMEWLKVSENSPPDNWIGCTRGDGGGVDWYETNDKAGAIAKDNESRNAEHHPYPVYWLKETPAPVPDPVWDAEKVAKLLEWVNGRYFQATKAGDPGKGDWVKHWTPIYDEDPSLPDIETTAQLMQTFLNRPK